MSLALALKSASFALVYSLDEAYAEWSFAWEWPLFTCLIFLSYAAFGRLLSFEPLFSSFDRIPGKGPKLKDEDLTRRDYFYVFINEFITVFYAVESAKLLKHADYIVHGIENVTFSNTVLPVFLCCGAYDLIYGMCLIFFCCFHFIYGNSF